MLNLNFKEFGQGEPVVILHGLFGTLDNWQTVAKMLSEHFLVYILDLRNHGRSPHTEGVVDYASMAEDVGLFMQQNWLHEARVVGHSMGGKVAMALALTQPDWVKKLAIVDIAPKTYRGGHEQIFDALFSIDLAKLTDRKEAERLLTEKLGDDSGTIQFLLKNLSRKPESEGGGFEWKMNLDVLHRDYSNILSDVVEGIFDKETLFIRGSQSNYIQDIDFKTIMKRFPKAELTTIAGAGHWVHAEKPRELCAALLDFL
ncbi:MAG: alpha/beta fold hydrolase [Saprospiraceae bacterium]|nr:alpha/beta fold hydrolase [Saprospiraceae bacterium]